MCPALRFLPRLSVLALLACAAPLSAAEPTYWQEVRPVLRKYCTVCHSEKNLRELDVSAGLALDSLAAIRKGGKQPVIGKKAADSLFISILRHAKPERRMPLDAEPLPDAVVALLSKWVDAGLPEGERPAEAGALTPAKAGPPKRTDITLATKALVPKALAKPGQSAPLEVTVPIGPLAPVTAVTYSPNGRFLACGAYGRVTVWDLKEMRLATVLTNVLGAVNDVRFSPDGKTLATAGGQPSARGDIRLFTTTDWKLQATLGGHSDVVGSIAFAPDGRTLASASFDKTVRLWDMAARKCSHTFTGHSDFVHAVAFAPSGTWIATASKDKTSRVIDIKTGQSRLTLSGTDQEVLAIGIKSDGTTIVTAGLDPTLSWWNADTGERVKRTTGHNLPVNEIAVGSSGELAASAGTDKSVRLWNTKTIDSQRTIPVGSVVFSVSLSHDGRFVAAGSFDGLVRIYETSQGRSLATLAAAADAEWLAVTPEGFAACSDAVARQSRWRSGSVQVAADWVWKAVKHPEFVVKAVAGQKLGEPVFPGPQP